MGVIIAGLFASEIWGLFTKGVGKGILSEFYEAALIVPKGRGNPHFEENTANMLNKIINYYKYITQYFFQGDWRATFHILPKSLIVSEFRPFAYFPGETPNQLTHTHITAPFLEAAKEQPSPEVQKLLQLKRTPTKRARSQIIEIILTLYIVKDSQTLKYRKERRTVPWIQKQQMYM